MNTTRNYFFRAIDWASFGVATAVSFLVYFFTLGPSVGLEDSGELATAANSLGVPHPPGYPSWTMLCWVFCRLFSWVTFRGQPTPAFAVSLASAVVGALATGVTAMLITRSGADMLRDIRSDKHDESTAKQDNLFCWAGGVGGALAFAFSPVMWSQSTIVEVYSLGALFLMWVFLLTYQWMKCPRNKTLWALAFVFGLGLTNYQVLLLALAALVFIIFMHNAKLFRDFLLAIVPIGLTALMLKAGAIVSAVPGMGGKDPVMLRHAPILTDLVVPQPLLLTLGVIVMIVALFAFLLLEGARYREEKYPQLAAFAEKIAGLKCMPVFVVAGVGAVLMLISTLTGSKIASLKVPEDFAPLINPSAYVLIAMTALGLVIAAAAGAFLKRKTTWGDNSLYPVYLLIAVLGVALLVQCAIIPDPKALANVQAPLFDWTMPTLATVAGLAFLFIIGGMTPGGLFYAIAVAAVQVPLLILMKKGAMVGLTHPSTWWFWWPIAWNFVNIMLIWLCLPNGRTVAPTIFFGELGVSFYAYMPIVSDLRNPPMNWGYPRTWEGFKHAIGRGQYEAITAQNIFTIKFLQQINDYCQDVRVQFTLLVAPLGILPFAGWGLRLRNKRIRMLFVSTIIFLTCSAFVFVAELLQTEPFQRIDMYLIGAMFLISAIGVGTILLDQFAEIAADSWRNRKTSEGITRALTLAAVAGGLVLLLAKSAAAIIEGVAPKVQIGDKIVVAQDSLAGMLGRGLPILCLLFATVAVLGTLAAWCYYGRRLREEGDAKFSLFNDINRVDQQWLIGTILAFLTMSLLLLVLASPTGDLQDYFIQKVKFVGSHGLFSLWIGYGLIFGLTVALTLFRFVSKKIPSLQVLMTPAVALCVLVTLAVPLVPIWENYMNEHLVFKASAAEQNGHDYGWQFGNYQLRGADAINEELEADEEPLPNPLYPPEMGQGAIFFGGTDPGRFVPTYMIYAAEVRSDVFLITQNALADNTYMSVMRDLYGNDIWIPTPGDSAYAFQVYVEEVQSGKRPANAALQIQNGRVQVSGALGVMEINGILCDMIFKHNIARHEFYIEESYVIPWMYPYLSPNGLIMRINEKPAELTQIRKEKDMDFWDWYTRRLSSKKSFRRDLVAQKSFSKLRSAIAGLYANRNQRQEAEIAFEEARMLYPVSPEANFRLVQEALLPTGQVDSAIRVLEELNRRDPNNLRGLSFAENLRRMVHNNARITELRKLVEAKTATIQQVRELADCYRENGSHREAASYYAQLITLPNISLDDICAMLVYIAEYGQGERTAALLDNVLKQHPIERLTGIQLKQLIQVATKANKHELMFQLLQRYVKVEPNDWQMWANLAILYYNSNRVENGHSALQRAIMLGRQEAVAALQDIPAIRPHLNAVINRLNQQAPMPRLPGGLTR